MLTPMSSASPAALGTGRVARRPLGGRGAAWLGWAVAAALGCGSPPPAAAPEPAPEPAPAPEPPTVLPLAPVPPILVRDVGFASPESVLYDAQSDVYLVSNVNGGPVDQDGNGFISRVLPDGTLDSLRWIAGKAAGVELDGPKGMALVGNTLYVADISVVRSFDRKTGAPIATVPIPSATCLNDVSAAADGSLYVSDSGLGKVRGKAELQNNGSDAVYTLDAQGVVGVLAKGADLGQPRSLLADGTGVLVVTLSGLLYRLVPPGERQALGALPAGGLAGMVQTEDGRLLVSSFETASVYVAKPPLEPTPTFAVLIGDLKSPADLGYDAKRRQLLVPLFEENAIYIQQVF